MEMSESEITVKGHIDVRACSGDKVQRGFVRYIMCKYIYILYYIMHKKLADQVINTNKAFHF